MNKLFTKIAGLTLGLAMAIGVGVAVGSNKNAVPVLAAPIETSFTTTSGGGFSNGSKTTDGITCTFDANGGTAVNWQAGHVRLYANGKIYFSSANDSITQIVISLTGDYANTWTASDSSTIATSASPKTATWTGNATEITLTNSSTAQQRLTSIKVYHEASSSKEVINKTIVGPDDIDFNVGDNSVDIASDVKVDGVQLDYDGGEGYSVTSSAPAIVSVSGTTITPVAMGDATITISKDDVETEETITKYKSATFVVSVTDPNAITVTAENLTDMSTTAGLVSATYKGITFTISNGLRGGTEHVRVYKNATLTISSQRNIKSISFTGVSGNPISNMSLTSGGGELTTEGNDGLWEGTSKNLVFTASANQTRISRFVISLEALTPIATLSMDETHSMYEGQDWEPTITYSAGASVQTCELVVVSGGEYVTISEGNIHANVGVMTKSSAEVVVKAHATDVESSTVYSNECTITINKNSVASVVVTTAPTKTEYVEGQNLDLSGMVLTVNWDVGQTTINSTTGYEGVTTTPSLSTSLTVEDHDGIEVSVSFGGQTTESTKGFTISVIAKAVINNGLTWSQMTKTYSVGNVLVADGNLNVKWNDGTENDYDVSDLYESSLVTFKLDNKNITPGTELTADDNGKSLNIYFGGKTTSTTISVKISGFVFMQKCTELTDLVDGGLYVIAAEANNKTYLMTSATSGKPAGFDNEDSYFDSDLGNLYTMKADTSYYGFTINGSGSNWEFTAVDDNKLGYSSSTNFASNGSNTDWTISVVNTHGTFSILNTSTAEANTKRVVAFNGSAFGSYSRNNIDGNSYWNVELYKVVDVSSITKLSITCDGEGTNTANWESLNESFSGLSNLFKAYYRHASYSVVGTGISTAVTATKGTDVDVAKFAAKYDYIVDKYERTDFIGRDGTAYDLYNSSNMSYLDAMNVDSSTFTMIILTVSLVSLTAIAGFVILRKRKEQ